MEQHYDDTFLARWEAGELTPEELEMFEKTTEYSEYKKISEGANRLEAPSYDRQKAWNELKKKRERQKTVRKSRIIPLAKALMDIRIKILRINDLWGSTRCIQSCPLGCYKP